MTKRLIIISIIFLSAATFAACSSSSSGNSSDSGDFEISLDPSRVLLGTIAVLDLQIFNIEFDDIDQEGITIKLLVSEALAYAADSALLQIEGGAVEIDPIFVGPYVEIDDEDLEDALGRKRDLNYIIFSLPAGLLDDANSGRLRFSLSAIAETSAANIFVDIDRGAISSFDPADPAFDVEGMYRASVINSLEEE